MKVSFLTTLTPTFENVGGPSALPYYILKYRDKSIDVEIFSYNTNFISEEKIRQIESDLNLKITLLDIPAWYKFIKKHKLTWIRVFLKYYLESYIKPTKSILKLLTNSNPDVILRYRSDFLWVSQQLPNYKHIVMGPDSPTLVYYRQLRDLSGYKSLVYFLGLAKVAYSAYLNATQDCCENSLHYVVGMEDYRELKRIAPNKKCFFLLHPHFQITEKHKIDLKSNKVYKVLIPGKNDFYMYTGSKELVFQLGQLDVELKQKFEFTFLGKGWEDETRYLCEKGVNCKHVTWVDNYIDAISEYDIQISPITVGAGTKGKVLDGIANGLLVIGTEVAIENIAVRNMDSCICYKSAVSIPTILRSIVNNPSKYENIAKKGMMQARKLHSPERCSKRFFGIIDDFLNNKSYLSK